MKELMEFLVGVLPLKITWSEMFIQEYYISLSDQCSRWLRGLYIIFQTQLVFKFGRILSNDVETY